MDMPSKPTSTAQNTQVVPLNCTPKKEIFHFKTKKQGYFEDGLKHGEGSFVYSDGKVFEGIYVNDKRHGRGRIDEETVYYVMGEQINEETYENYLQQQ